VTSVLRHFGSSIATYHDVLRITINEEPDKVMLKLEGRIVGPWTAELDRTWHSLGPSLNDKTLSVDLCGVSYIDRDGRGVLADIYRHTHARFEVDTPLMEYFVQEARDSGSKNGNGNGKGASK
jgi:ABC-type transporter Mla MlaB component